MEMTGEYSKISGQRSTKVRGTVTKSNISGVEGIIQFIKAHFGKREVPFVVKRLSRTEEESSGSPEQVMQKYTCLRSLGLPVLPTFRYDHVKKEFLMTDLTADGSIVIDKHTSTFLAQTIEIKNKEELFHTILDTAKRAYNNGNGLYLNLDAYTIAVNSKGIGTLWLVDIGIGSHILEHKKGTKIPGIVEESSVLSQAKQFIETRLYPLGVPRELEGQLKMENRK